jgi:hypothetical protein
VINTIKSYLSPSVDNITASLNTTVARLTKLATVKADTAVALREEGQRTQVAADQAEVESRHARLVAQRISKLLA